MRLSLYRIDFDTGLSYRGNRMYTVTAIYRNDSEIGYGEGEGYEYSMMECMESVDGIYLSDIENIKLVARREGSIMIVETPMSLYIDALALQA